MARPKTQTELDNLPVGVLREIENELRDMTIPMAQIATRHGAPASNFVKWCARRWPDLYLDRKMYRSRKAEAARERKTIFTRSACDTCEDLAQCRIAVMSGDPHILCNGWE